MRIIDIMKREDTLLRLVVLIFVNAGINTLILVLTISEIARNPNNILSTPQQLPFVTTSPELTILYISVGIILSIVSSLAFFPKRIVSPFYAQITTATILITIIYTLSFVVRPPVITADFLIGIMFGSGIIYGILGGVGWLQGWIVRKMIGANGDKDNIDYQTFSINAKFNEISKILLDQRFLRINDFIVHKQSEDKIVLQSRLDNNEKHVLVLIPHPEKEKHSDFSILCITSYVVRFDWLSKPTTVYEREEILGAVERILKISNNQDIVFKKESDDKVATNNALSQSLKITSSPFNQVRSYPKRHVIVIGLLFLIGFSVAGVHFYNNEAISNDTLVNTLVFLIIVFIADIYPTIKEKIQSR